MNVNRRSTPENENKISILTNVIDGRVIGRAENNITTIKSNNNAISVQYKAQKTEFLTAECISYRKHQNFIRG